MNRSVRLRGITLVEVLVVIVILVIVIALLMPAMSTSREAPRRADCLNKTKQLVLALHNYHDAHGRFPAAASPSHTDARNVDGYSFLYELLPYLECKPAYDQIKMENDKAHPDNRDPFKNSVAAKFRTGVFVCPSYAGPTFIDEANKQYAITNYKAMSATHKESLACATDPDAVPKYGDKDKHPDGGLVPLANSALRRDFIDGTSNTILIAETMDETGSYWAAGNTISLVALPSSVSYVQINRQYWAPAGFVPGKYDDEAKYDNPETYFNWDFDAKEPSSNAGPYELAKKMTAGPSSRHPSVINCGFGDGNARSIAKSIDPALLMFLVTRAGNDPSSEYFARRDG